MSVFRRSTLKLFSATSALAVAGLLTVAPVANASSTDFDRDGMPNRWESAHHLNPRVANAQADRDRDGLNNLGEYRSHTNPSVEDTDGDGDDDGDEVKDGFASTSVTDADTDADGTLDGDEDANHDGIDNEDADD